MSDSVWHRDMVHRLLRSKPFYIICCGGVCGVLPDIDHIISYYWLKELDGCFLHTPLLIWAGTLIVIMCSYYSGFYAKYLLNKHRNKDIE